MKIDNIIARQILDSRGNPTVEVDVWLAGGFFGRSAVPSGASTGVHEAHELRDGGSAFGGLGVEDAVNNIVNEILPVLKGVPADDQFLIDQKMIDLDGTANKSKLGANAILAVSLAVAHAAAKARGLPLYRHINDISHSPKMSIPMPMMNVLNGGKHALGSSDFQEFMIIPISAKRYSEAVRIGSEIFQALKQQIISNGGSSTVGDEGGFTFPVTNNKDMLDLLVQACIRAGYSPGVDVVFALDVAASEFYKDDFYELKCENRQLSGNDLVYYLDEIRTDYPVVSIEDGLDQDDWYGWPQMMRRLPELQIVGDDLLVTNIARLKRAIEEKSANAILIKPNQIGTLTETIRAIEKAKKAGWRTIVSHRSGETEDVTIAHIAVGTGAEQIKTGSLSRGERTAKHNELMRIQEMDSSLKMANPFL
jgi:enolase